MPYSIYQKDWIGVQGMMDPGFGFRVRDLDSFCVSLTTNIRINLQ